MTARDKPRVLLLGDRSRDDICGVMDAIQKDLRAHVSAFLNDPCPDGGQLPEGLAADLAVVVGGDGAVIGQSRRLVGRDLPLIGVNCGRLGFLAAFDHDALRDQADVVFGGEPPIRQHMLLQVVHESSGSVVRTVSVNDAVITAGPPYRMIEAVLRIGGVHGPHLRGDGLIVASPTGSTAHNLSAGGPIIGPGVDALVVSPIAPQSLAFRPIVMDAVRGVEIEVRRCNEGTTLVVDGQQQSPLREGDRVQVLRHDQTIPMVTRPGEPFWRILLERMRWAAPPVFR
ncbi:MAG: NAD(+)/NADH kinase [Phycisphaerales bacterium]|jgi:NAD+ kinase|nr:NAD(+)/NADH kinase [Phycisphaerales bacterium]